MSERADQDQDQDQDQQPVAAAAEAGPSANCARRLVLLRYAMIAATSVLLCAESGFRLPSAGVLLLIAFALASNAVVGRLPARLVDRAPFGIVLILTDALWVTTALATSGGFPGHFVSPYFLFAAATAYGYLVHRFSGAHSREREAALERALAQRTADLASASKELTAFISSVSHDLRAPLRAIDAFSELLVEDHARSFDAEGRDYLERVRRNALRMSKLIDALVKLSRLAQAEMRVEPIDLSDIAQSIAAELRGTAPERAVSFAIEPGVTALGDAHLVRVLLENLIGNAWKYTGRHPAANIAFGATVRDGETVYYVRDDGAGFDPAHAKHLFRPFHRLHAAGDFDGTGIGLATAQRVVRSHGGRIWADAAPERGATFFFTLSGASNA